MDHKEHAEEFPKENEIIELLPCKICKRSFRPALLQRHTVICEKNAKKRKITFDSSKQRREGTEMAAYPSHVNKTNDDRIELKKKKTNWKAKHEELIRTLKAARGEIVDDKRITKPVGTEACPHCARNFGPNSYDRHVEFCKDKAQRISTAPVASQLAKERLKARIEYRAPPLKTKRQVDDKRITIQPVDTKACPHCARNFGPNAYDRHIEFCKEKAQRMSTGPVISQLAKNRLEARIQYRAPPLKSQHAAIKENTRSNFQNNSSASIKATQPMEKDKNRMSPRNGPSTTIPRQSTVIKKIDQIPKNSCGMKNKIPPKPVMKKAESGCIIGAITVKNAIPPKPIKKKDTVMKKAESAYIIETQNSVKQNANRFVSNFEKKNVSKE